jgi:hypothetical protein
MDPATGTPNTGIASCKKTPADGGLADAAR